MRTIALRFAENFVPACGTIAAHQEVIDDIGQVWYGKLGSAVSDRTAREILANDDPCFLLIHSGGQDRWWVHIEKAQRETPPLNEIPEYYRRKVDGFGCWFKVKRFELASGDVMSRCVVASSRRTLSTASRRSMSPYFIIDFDGERTGQDE